VNQNVHLKFLNHNGRQFRLHYARGPTDTLGSRVHMTLTWGQAMSLPPLLPCSYVPAAA